MEGVNPKTRQKVVVLGWTCLLGPSTRGKSQNDLEQLDSGPRRVGERLPASMAAASKTAARQAAGCALPKPMAAHGHVNGWREGTA